jgi:hypothetical protein
MLSNITNNQKPSTPPTSDLMAGNVLEDSLLPVSNIQKPPRVGCRSRSFFSIPDHFKDITSHAEGVVRYYTLFENPMLKPTEILTLIQTAWQTAQAELDKHLDRPKQVDAHVSQKRLRYASDFG